MTEQTLDQVARALSTGMPRRQVVKGVLGGAAAGAVALFGVRSSGAKSSSCDRGFRRCGDRCYDPELECCKHCEGGGAIVFDAGACQTIRCGKHV